MTPAKILGDLALGSGSCHDFTAAREHCLGAHYLVAAAGLPTLATELRGCGERGHTPIKGRDLGVGNCTYNGLLAGTRTVREQPTRYWTNAEPSGAASPLSCY